MHGTIDLVDTAHLDAADVDTAVASSVEPVVPARRAAGGRAARQLSGGDPPQSSGGAG